MTAVGISAGALLLDGLRVCGLSVVLSLAYHLLRLLLPLRSRVAAYAVHTFFFAACGLLFFCFMLGQTAVQSPRWILFAGLVGGAAVYAVCFAPLVDAAARRLCGAVRAVFRPVAAFFRGAYRLVILPGVSRLQKVYGKLYNDRRKRRGSHAPRKEANGAEKRKEPIQVYTQT
ncbi:MAG: hypothetical protein VB092_06525 [Oscillospiraceae bacterium]|nr:hypothetical protein [Oscillospiraceae bacterium]